MIRVFDARPGLRCPNYGYLTPDLTELCLLFSIHYVTHLSIPVIWPVIGLRSWYTTCLQL